MNRTAMAGMILAGALAFGQDQPKPPDKKPQPKKQETVVVSASPIKGVDPANVPYSVDVVESKEMQNERLSRTIPDAMKENPSVSIQKTSAGHGSPFIRGFTGFRNVFLIDGIRLNGSFFREGPNQYWNTVDSFMIDRMEIIKGPASVLYGSDAMGGAVNVYTKGRETFESGYHMEGRSTARGSAGERSLFGRQEVQGNQDDFGWFVGGTGKYFGDVVGGDHVGEQEYTNYDEYDGDMKLTFRLSPNVKIHAAVQTTRQFDVPRTHRTIYREGWHGIAPGGAADDQRHEFDQRRDLVYVRFEANRLGTAIDAVDLSISVHQQGEDFLRVLANNTREIRSFNATTPGVVLKLGSDTPIGYFTCGGEYYHEDIQSDGRNTTTAGTVSFLGRGDIADDSEYDLLGLFIQDEIELAKGLFVTLGGRFTWAHLNADQVALNAGSRTTGNALINPFLTTVPSIDDEYQAIIGSGNILYKVTPEFSVFGGVSQSFRAPGLDDTTSFRQRTGGQSLDLPSPGLDPELGLQFEFGARFQQGRWKAGFAAFYTILEDHIRRVPTIDVDGNGSIDSPKQNASEGEVHGVEGYGQVPLGEDLTVWGAVAWTEGYADDPSLPGTPSRPLSKVNPVTGVVKIRYAPIDAAYWVEFVALMAGIQDHLSSDDRADNRIPPGGTPGFTVLTIRGGYRFNDSVSATLALENLTNKDYRFHGSGQNEPGFNAILGIDLRY